MSALCTSRFSLRNSALRLSVCWRRSACSKTNSGAPMTGTWPRSPRLMNHSVMQCVFIPGSTVVRVEAGRDRMIRRQQ
jgi:hypothetical protein